jgi:hypothetical protein
MTVPFAFANLSGNIALAKLDSNFNTPITIGNTSVLLGNTITTINNVTLANVTISSGTASNISLTSPLAVSSGGTGSANLTVNNVLIGNGTSAVTSVAPGTTGNVLTSIGGAWVSNVALTSVAAGSNTQIQYNNANLLAGSANLTFDGSTVGVFGGTTVNYRLNANRGTDDVTQGVRVGFAGLDAYRTGVALASPQTQLSFTQTGSDGTRTPYYIDTSGNSVWSPGASASPSEVMRLTSTGLGIGTSSPSASAILDAQSTTKGVRMPNMTTTQKNAISSPAAGLMVFDTTLAKLCVYSGSAWQTITSV